MIVEIKVIPGSGRQKCVLDRSDQLKCYLKNQPEKGKANKELVMFLAKAVGVSQNEVEIVSGAISKKKRIKINTDLSFEQLLARLGIERQRKIF